MKTNTETNEAFVTDPLPPTASRKRTWAWVLLICGSLVAATACFYPHIALFSSGGVEATKPAKAATPTNKFTVLHGNTIAVASDDEENSGWGAFLVPEHGNALTIYFQSMGRS